MVRHVDVQRVSQRQHRHQQGDQCNGGDCDDGAEADSRHVVRTRGSRAA